MYAVKQMKKNLVFRFAAIGQDEIGEQLRAALTEGYTGDDDGPGNIKRLCIIEVLIIFSHQASVNEEGLKIC